MLTEASRYGLTEVVRHLIEAGANVGYLSLISAHQGANDAIIVLLNKHARGETR